MIMIPFPATFYLIWVLGCDHDDGGHSFSSYARRRRGHGLVPRLDRTRPKK
jgi:hypothetical protein